MTKIGYASLVIVKMAHDHARAPSRSLVECVFHPNELDRIPLLSLSALFLFSQIVQVTRRFGVLRLGTR